MPTPNNNLDPPRYDPISFEELTQSDGSHPNRPILVAIKGVVFDVSSNPAFAPGGCYHVFAGKDASHAMACSSRNPKDCTAECHDIGDAEQTILDEWFECYRRKYNIVGTVMEGDQDEREDADTEDIF
ncbi:hypothetical protein ASPZODRAFT_26709 [Penicilliopsis zonata CBS 506.65]|uniref:Cytochrome b5 heme-binding domain-containing protein n=1 Tax=Penicilliopsis zonata CBS 506.65 TaxID=1073090 RepID=A0A1L9SDT1_9EURO|nr:hypothetical protein ASPZODRAFT_26709 [Penicilliopsis zonata CBS 506.65]OJJ45356.1 hypothetical protein ASPZODRAFT_26709 [Penicilliopsis zonata CBS 506.65]